MHDANTVNISGRYHHGDLRRALIEAGLRRVGTGVLADLSLREIARAVGVSATAVYRHFPDKAALMAALAREGLNRLAQCQQAAFDAAGGGRAGFAATGRAYVRFALAHPALFRLTFSSAPAPRGDADPDPRRFLQANAEAGRAAGTPADLVDTDALRAWALVHGIAMLMLDGRLPPEDRLIDALLSDAAACASGAVTPRQAAEPGP